LLPLSSTRSSEYRHSCSSAWVNPTDSKGKREKMLDKTIADSFRLAMRRHLYRTQVKIRFPQPHAGILLFRRGENMTDPHVNLLKDDSGVVLVRGKASGFEQNITAGRHQLKSDEPINVGGTNTGPSPYDLLLAALGSCTSMTVALYARRKQWPIRDVEVRLKHSRIYANDCGDCETKVGMLDKIEREIVLTGPLTEEQRTRLLEIANKCPVHRTLASEITIESWLA
jgi:uncharacterized OsmC-like protein